MHNPTSPLPLLHSLRATALTTLALPTALALTERILALSANSRIEKRKYIWILGLMHKWNVAEEVVSSTTHEETGKEEEEEVGDIYLRAKVYANVNRVAEAIELLKNLLAEEEFAETEEISIFPFGTQIIKFRSTVLTLLGQLHFKQEDTHNAKIAYAEALMHDPRSVEAFEGLIGNYLLTPQEEKLLFERLPYKDLGDYAEFVTLLHKTQSSEPNNDVTKSISTLHKKYNLKGDIALTIAQAEDDFNRRNYKRCVDVLAPIIQWNLTNSRLVLIQIAALYARNDTSSLYLLGHRLMDLDPSSATAWYAVGIYYMSINKVDICKRYLSKATQIETSFVPALVAFGHACSRERESDSAIVQYSTASRFSPGVHLPRVFMAMQYMSSAPDMAMDWLKQAESLCSTDPLVYNELGYMYYQRNDYAMAANHFENGLHLARASGAPMKEWHITMSNLAHCHRQCGRYNIAKKLLLEVLRYTKGTSHLYTHLGLLDHLGDNLSDAILYYHQALSLEQESDLARDLLEKALIACNDSSMLMIQDEEITLTEEGMWVETFV